MDYTVTILYNDDTILWDNVTRDILIESGNVINYIDKKYGIDNIKVITIKILRVDTIIYDADIEKHLNSRVELTYKWVHGGFTTIKCYIGRSSGFIPRYLENKSKKSKGGFPLAVEYIDSIRSLDKKKDSV